VVDVAAEMVAVGLATVMVISSVHETPFVVTVQVYVVVVLGETLMVGVVAPLDQR